MSERLTRLRDIHELGSCLTALVNSPSSHHKRLRLLLRSVRVLAEDHLPVYGRSCQGDHRVAGKGLTVFTHGAKLSLKSWQNR